MDWKDVTNTVRPQQLAAVTDTLRDGTEVRVHEQIEVPMNSFVSVEAWPMNVRNPFFYEILNEPIVHRDQSELTQAWTLADARWAAPGEDIMNAEEMPEKMEMLALIRKTWV